MAVVGGGQLNNVVGGPVGGQEEAQPRNTDTVTPAGGDRDEGGEMRRYVAELSASAEAVDQADNQGTLDLAPSLAQAAQEWIQDNNDDNQEEDNDTESLPPISENFRDLNDTFDITPPTNNICENDHDNSENNQEGVNLNSNVNNDNTANSSENNPSLVKESKGNHLPELVKQSNHCNSHVESTSQTVRDYNEDIEVHQVAREENITENDELSTTDIQV